MFLISRYTRVRRTQSTARAALTVSILLAALFATAFATSAVAETSQKLSYDVAVVDATKGPEAAAAEARLDALREAVRRYELYNENVRVKLRRVDRDARPLGRKLERADGAVFGTAAALDDAVAAGVVTLTANLNVGYSHSIGSLLDTLTAFVDGTEAIAIDAAADDEVRARRFVPPMFTDLEPRRTPPGQLVLMVVDYGYYGGTGSIFAELGGTTAAIGGPDVNLETFELNGYNLLVPPEASTGYVRLEIPSAGTPAVSRELRSPYELEIEPLAPAARPEIAAAAPPPTDDHCDTVNVVFKRLGSPNFFSETADSKDVVIADYENDGKLDVFVPQTLSHPETEYKGQGNDNAGLPKFATIVSGLLTNDIPGKRQYGASAGDVDGDGDLDIVPSGANNQGTNERVRLLINNGNITFTNEGLTRISGYNSVAGFEHSWDEIALDDVDGDGDLDVAMANRSTDPTGHSALLLNTGGGFFDAHPSGLGEPANEVHHDVYFCDVDNDGDPDVLLSQDMRGAQRPLRLMVNNGDGNPGANVPPTFTDGTSRLIPNPAAHSEHVACRDFNNDGRLDIHAGVWDRSDQTDDQDMIFLNNTADTNFNGTIELSEIRFDLVANPDPGSVVGEGFRVPAYAATYGDFTGDGKVDVVVISFTGSNKGPYLMCNNGNGTFDNISPTGAFWRDLSNTGFDHFNGTSADVADLNGDGKQDIVFGLGDGMNGPMEEPNRIYVLESVTNGSGDVHCSQLYGAAQPAPEPCFEDSFEARGLELDPAAVGEVRLLPLASACREAVDCQPCGNQYLGCDERFELIFDFAAAGVDPRVADVRLIDFAGRELGVGRDRGGEKTLAFKPEGEFRAGGLDQELLVELRLHEPVGDSGVVVPVRLEREAVKK